MNYQEEIISGNLMVSFNMEITPIAKIITGFNDKFGIPRQSCIVPESTGKIVFEGRFRNPDAIRGLEEFSHIWVIWQFSESIEKEPGLMVRPPKLGGNIKVGVFASRSPFRPNHLGLSCLKLESIETGKSDSPALLVSGVDMLNGTPIYDVKPYVPMADCHADASEGYTSRTAKCRLEVVFPDSLAEMIPHDKREELKNLLSLDPRPGYKITDGEIFGMPYGRFDIRFTVSNGVLTVKQIVGND